MNLITCKECGEYFYRIEKKCPHCIDTLNSSSKKRFSSNALLLGLALVGCGDKDEDTSSSEPATEPATEPASEPAIENDYGVPDTGVAEEE